MSDRAIYLRDQADKCEWHAAQIEDVVTQAALRRLAAKYVVEANKIDAQEIAGPQFD